MRQLTPFGCLITFTLMLSIACFALGVTSCTISFQNFDTHGTTTEEEQQTTTPDISTQATLPLK